MAQDGSLDSLEVEALHYEVYRFLLEANSCLRKEPSSQVHQHLRQAGFKKLPQVYKSAYRDLQVVEGLQRLRIPVSVEGAQVPPDLAYAGSTDNVAGISEEAFIAANAPGLGTRQAWHAELAPELETRLSDRCDWIAKILEHTGETTAIVEAAAEEVDGLEAANHQNHSLLLELAEDLCCYLSLLSDLLDRQLAFVLDRKLTTQKELDTEESRYQRANCRAQILKVQVIQQRLLSFTYTDHTVPALHKVSGHLEAAERQAEAAHQQLSGRLQQYETLGPEFASLAQQHSQLMEDLRHAEFTLEEFRQAAATDDSLEA